MQKNVIKTVIINKDLNNSRKPNNTSFSLSCLFKNLLFAGAHKPKAARDEMRKESFNLKNSTSAKEMIQECLGN